MGTVDLGIARGPGGAHPGARFGARFSFGPRRFDQAVPDEPTDRLIDPDNADSDDAYNLQQSLIAVGSGGFFGKGLGHATQSAGGFLPEFHTDFVFAFLSETFGFCGSFLLLCLYVLLMFSTIRVAFKCESLFLRLSCVGIVGMWAFQTFENIGMCIGMMPITGIPLPFISFGSSSMMIQLLTVGIVQSIWRHRSGAA